MKNESEFKKTNKTENVFLKVRVRRHLRKLLNFKYMGHKNLFEQSLAAESNKALIQHKYIFKS
jgi:hypothetical protein